MLVYNETQAWLFAELFRLLIITINRQDVSFPQQNQLATLPQAKLIREVFK